MTASAAATEQTQAVEVPADRNAIVAKAYDHSWISVLRGGDEIITERSGRPEVMFVVGPGSYEVRSDGTVEEVSTRTLELPQAAALETGEAIHLVLSADAPDRHRVDGVGEIPADGQSYCTVTVEKVRSGGERAAGDEGAGEIFLRATGGVIMDNRGGRHIRSIRLRRGRATFRVVSEEQPRFIRVLAFDRKGSAAELQLEFV
jgi:hypothetical protein